MTPKTRPLVLVAMFALLGLSAPLVSQEDPFGLVVFHNTTMSSITLFGGKMVTRDGTVDLSQASWTFDPNSGARLQINDKDLFAKTFQGSILTEEGSTNWTWTYSPKDSSGTFSLQCDNSLLRQHYESLAKVPRLGVFMEVAPKGVLVTKLPPASPAGRAGIRVGDVLTRVSGSKITDPESVSRSLASRSPGQTVTVSALRSGVPMSFNVVLGQAAVIPPALTGPTTEAVAFAVGKAILGAAAWHVALDVYNESSDDLLEVLMKEAVLQLAREALVAAMTSAVGDLGPSLSSRDRTIVGSFLSSVVRGEAPSIPQTDGSGAISRLLVANGLATSTAERIASSVATIARRIGSRPTK